MPRSNGAITAELPRVAVIIPALNEAGNIAVLVAELAATVAAEIIDVDNGSTDATAAEAAAAGARVVSEPRRGYGYACAAGVAAVRDADLVAFIDGDGSRQACQRRPASSHGHWSVSHCARTMRAVHCRPLLVRASGH